MQDALLPCPFCGSRKVKLGKYRSIRFVVCEVCHADGPAKDTDSQAVEAWNHRPEPSQGDGQ